MRGLRLARQDALEEIFARYAARVRWMNEVGIHQWNDTDYLNAYPADYYREMRAKDCLYVLTDVATGKITGAAVLLSEDERWTECEDEPAFYVHNLVTDSSAPGAGRALLAAAEALGQAHGKRYMRLDCAVDSAFLNGYYESLGYRAAGQCEDGPYVGVKRQKEL